MAGLPTWCRQAHPRTSMDQCWKSQTGRWSARGLRFLSTLPSCQDTVSGWLGEHCLPPLLQKLCTPASPHSCLACTTGAALRLPSIAAASPGLPVQVQSCWETTVAMET